MEHIPKETWFRPTANQLATIVDLTEGRGGSDDESFVVDCGWEAHKGFVTVECGHGSRAARIIKRCPSHIREVRCILQEGALTVSFRIDRAAFRGIEYAFRLVQ